MVVVRNVRVHICVFTLKHHHHHINLNNGETGTDTIIAWNLASSTRLDMLCRHDLQHIDFETKRNESNVDEMKKMDFVTRKKKRKQKFDKNLKASYAEQRILSLSKLSRHRVLATDSSGRIQVLRIRVRQSRMGSNGTHQYYEDTRSHELVMLNQCVRRYFNTSPKEITLSNITLEHRYPNQDLHFVLLRSRTVFRILSQSGTRTALYF